MNYDLANEATVCEPLACEQRRCHQPQLMLPVAASNARSRQATILIHQHFLRPLRQKASSPAFHFRTPELN